MAAGVPLLAADTPAALTLKKYCVACHGKAAANAGIQVEQLLAEPEARLGDRFAHWQKMAAVLEQKRMPPEKLPQPTDAERQQAVQWIRTRLNTYIQRNAGDPGRVTVRQLTSGEYGYAVRDLTGFDIKLDRDGATDAVGGEGFTNFGDVQFMQDAGLEQYLAAAKTVASHAVIGSGPLSFYPDPGKSGFEMSAIHRIHGIYQKHGFRAASAEGGRAFGLERYAQALYVAWRYQHRQTLGLPASTTLEQIAGKEGLSPRFARHIWNAVQKEGPGFPTTEVVSRFRALPAPSGPNPPAQFLADVKAGCATAQKFIIDWPRWLFAAGALAEGGQGDERALVLTEASVPVVTSSNFRFFMRHSKDKPARMHLVVASANPSSKDKPTIRWHNAKVRFRKADRSAGPQQPLSGALSPATAQRIRLNAETSEFVTNGDVSLELDFAAPPDAAAVELSIDGSIQAGAAGDAVVRATVADRADLSVGRPPAWALLGDMKSAGTRQWKANVLEYASNFPQASHGEPTPADRDPIPAPFNNAYNQPERDWYHTNIKYFRDDKFLVEKMLDDATRVDLEDAWADLFASFEYHDTFLGFVARKYKIDLNDKRIAALTDADVAGMPAEAKPYVEELRSNYAAVMARQQASHPRHVEDAIALAEAAWRRPLTAAEKDRLRAFYTRSREAGKLDHPEAIRALLARVLMSPAFLYRVETEPGQVATAPRTLTSWEMASRLSFFLWSSLPDAELRRAAAAGELTTQAGLEKQVKRMLADAKARRLSTEFFGQWLGFYKFDQYRGVDTGRFPEFTDELKSAMYDEAVSLFEHIIRKDRPVGEVLFADYAFLNKPLAKHYGVKREVKSEREAELVENAGEFQRGGLLRLGAVLTATSAPLRTSPVKRGDWILRRILGTPTPPPPADAGSIPADDKQFAGQTVRERLESHKRNPTCAACHMRIDPLGFPLERFDPVGRWRDSYADGKPIHDAASLADKTHLAGVNGLLEYLKNNEQQVLRTMSRKMVGYALGRTVLGSDEPLLDRMVAGGGATNFSKLVTEIVTSRQFRYRRGGGETSQQAPGTTPQTAGGLP